MDPDLPDESFFDLAATQGLFLYFLNRNLYACGLMPGQLDLSIGTLSKVGFLGLNELQVVLLYVRQKLLETLLLRREAAFVIRLLNEGSGSLDALHVRQEN